MTLLNMTETLTKMQQKATAIMEDLWWGKRKKIIAPYMKPSKKKAVIQIINSFGPFLGIWILMYISWVYLPIWSLAIVIPLAMVNAFFLVRIFIIQHDCGHQSFFGVRNRRINDAIGKICGLFSTIPYGYWARTHTFHHAHTWILENQVRDIWDIYFMTVEEYKNAGWFRKFTYKVFRAPIVLFFFAPIVYFIFMMRMPLISFKGMTKKIRWDQVVDNLLLVWFYVSLALLLWRKPFLLIQGSIVFWFSVIAFWFFYVQHQHEESYQARHDKWDYVTSAIIGSTYYKLPKIFQRLTGNIWIHHVHHLSSAIPNYNLQRCIDENEVLNKHTTIMWFRDSTKVAFNKLRDEKEEKMIGWRTYRRKYKKK